MLNKLRVTSAGFEEIEKYIAGDEFANAGANDKIRMYGLRESIQKSRPKKSDELTPDDVRMLWLTGAADHGKSARGDVLYIPTEVDYVCPDILRKYENVYSFENGLGKAEEFLENSERKIGGYIRENYPDGIGGERDDAGKRKMRLPKAGIPGAVTRTVGFRPLNTYAGEGIRAVYSPYSVLSVAGAATHDIHSAALIKESKHRLSTGASSLLMPGYRTEDRKRVIKELGKKSRSLFAGRDLTESGLDELKTAYVTGRINNTEISAEQKDIIGRIMSFKLAENSDELKNNFGHVLRAGGIDYQGDGRITDRTDRKNMIAAISKSAEEDSRNLRILRKLEKDIRKADRHTRTKPETAEETLKLKKQIREKKELRKNMEIYDRVGSAPKTPRAAVRYIEGKLEPTYFGTGLNETAKVYSYASGPAKVIRRRTEKLPRKPPEEKIRGARKKQEKKKPVKTVTPFKRKTEKVKYAAVRGISAVTAPVDFSLYKVRLFGKKLSGTTVKAAVFIFVSLCCLSGISLIGTGVVQGMQGMSLSSDENVDADIIDGNQEEGGSVTEDRLLLCTMLDKALRIYMKQLYTCSEAVSEIAGSPGIREETVSGNWYTYGSGREYAEPELGRNINGKQTGISCRFYNGDGEETGFRSNARDIISAANVWMEETNTAVGLYKSYVEKLWNYSHIVAYNPKKQENGNYIYMCDMTENDRCYKENKYLYFCNNPAAAVYGKDGGFADRYLLGKCSQDSSLAVYSEHGCSKHEYLFCSPGGSLNAENEGILYDRPIDGCDNCSSVSVAGGTKYYCRGHGTHGVCTSACSEEKSQQITGIRCFDGYLEETRVVYGYYPDFEIPETYTVWQKNSSSPMNCQELIQRCGCTGTVVSTSGGGTTYRIMDSSCRYCGKSMLKCPGCRVRTGDGSYMTVYHTGERYIEQETVHIVYACPGNHSCTVTTGACSGYCPGHVIHYCTGHVDIDVYCITLFLEDKNSLAGLGVYDRTEAEIRKMEITRGETTESRRVEIRVPCEGASCIYSGLDVFSEIRTVHRLPSMDFDDLYDDELGTADFSVIENVGTASSTMKFFCRDCNVFMEDGASDMNGLIRRYSECFDPSVYRWVDYNDAIPESVDISHLGGYYSKFSTSAVKRDNVFEGWYRYNEDGTIATYIDNEGNVLYCDTGNIDRAVTMSGDDDLFPFFPKDIG